MKTAYCSINFRSATYDLINKANAICAEYAQQGLLITLRQCYYQFVARGWLPNKDTEYNKLGTTISDARLAGMLDWSYLEDRTRNLAQLSHWDSPEDIVAICAKQYRNRLWGSQPFYCEVWVEKEALSGVVARTANELDVPYIACRGYMSQSEMHAAGLRLREKIDEGKEVVIFHLGDHDPSGIDMTRDIEERLSMFVCDGDYWRWTCDAIKEMYGSTHGPFDVNSDVLDDHYYDSSGGVDRPRVDVRRIALNMSQIRQYNPPPNPAKLSDTRAEDYIRKFGSQSWELDALDPATLDALIRTNVLSIRDEELWNAAIAKQEEDRTVLEALSTHWDAVEEYANEQLITKE